MIEFVCNACQHVASKGPRGPLMLAALVLAIFDAPMVCPACKARNSLTARQAPPPVPAPVRA